MFVTFYVTPQPPKHFEKQLFEKVNSQTDLKLTENQAILISQIAQSQLHSFHDFTNISKMRISNLADFKIQSFRKSESKIRIYIQQRSHSEDQMITGTSKRFTKCFRINLTFDGENNTNIKISKVACLRLNFSSDRPQHENFAKEIKLLNSIKKKPHICKLKNAAEYEGSHLKKTAIKMVMYQRLYLFDLYEFINKYDITPPSQIILQILKDILIGLRELRQGLRELHQDNYNHNDLKPENIFIDDKHRAYLADFGFTMPDKILTIGTPALLSPEHLNIFCDPTKKVISGPERDIWSLGCTFVMMLTKDYPYCSSFAETFFHFLLLQEKINIAIKNSFKVSEDFLKQLNKSAPNYFSKVKQLCKSFETSNTELKELKNDFPKASLFDNIYDPLKKSCALYEKLCDDYTNLMSMNGIESSEKDFLMLHKDIINYIISKKIHHFCENIIASLKNILEIIWAHMQTHEDKQPLEFFLANKMLQINPQNRIRLEDILKILEKELK